MAEKDIWQQDDKDIIKFIEHKMFAPARYWKFLYSGKDQSIWLEKIKFYKGMQFPKSRDKSKATVVYNRIFSSIQKELPFMTDRAPKIYIQPEEPSDKTVAKIFEKLIENAWRERGMLMKLPEGVLNAKQVGTAFFRPYWDASLANGLGDVNCEVVDPLELFPFAYTKDLESGDGVIHSRWVSLRYIKKNFPKEGWRVKAEGDKNSFLPDRAKETNDGSEVTYEQVSDMGTTAGYVPNETNYLPSPSGSSVEKDDYKRVLLVSLFFKDPSLYKDDDKKNKVKKGDPVYPYGRIITYANGVILEDEPYQFQFVPFVDYKNYVNASEYWAMDDIEQIMSPQKALNKISSDILEAVKRGVFTTKFVLKGSGVDVDDFVVTDDSTYETSVPNPVSELSPQVLIPQVMTYPAELERAIATTSGTQDYSPPSSGDLPSGAALGQLNEINQTRLRQKIRNLGQTVRLIGKAWLEMMLTNYTESRIMRIYNNQDGGVEYVYIFKEPNPEMAKEIKKQISQETIPGTEQIGQDGKPVPNSGTPKYQHIINLAEVKGGFDLSVADNSTVSVSKVANFAQSASLYQLGVIDQEALLEAADYPNREEIVKRMQAKQQQAMQAQSQATQTQVQGEMQKEQMKSQTTMQKSQMDNTTKVKVEQIKSQDKNVDRLMKLRSDINAF